LALVSMSAAQRRAAPASRRWATASALKLPEVVVVDRAHLAHHAQPQTGVELLRGPQAGLELRTQQADREVRDPPAAVEAAEAQAPTRTVAGAPVQLDHRRRLVAVGLHVHDAHRLRAADALAVLALDLVALVRAAVDAHEQARAQRALADGLRVRARQARRQDARDALLLGVAAARQREDGHRREQCGSP